MYDHFCLVWMRLSVLVSLCRESKLLLFLALGILSLVFWLCKKSASEGTEICRNFSFPQLPQPTKSQTPNWKEEKKKKKKKMVLALMITLVFFFNHEIHTQKPESNERNLKKTRILWSIINTCNYKTTIYQSEHQIKCLCHVSVETNVERTVSFSSCRYCIATDHQIFALWELLEAFLKADGYPKWNLILPIHWNCNKVHLYMVLWNCHQQILHTKKLQTSN